MSRANRGVPKSSLSVAQFVSVLDHNLLYDTHRHPDDHTDYGTHLLCMTSGYVFKPFTEFERTYQMG